MLKINNIRQIALSGGEPSTRSDLFEIIDYIHKSGISINMISNGKNIDDHFLQKLSKFQVLLSISVPGIETFVKHTKVDNIEHVLELFTKAKEYGIKTCANIAVTKLNLPELYENITLPILNGATYILLNRFMLGGRGMRNKQLTLSNEETNEMLDTAEVALSDAQIHGHVGTELPLCIIKDPTHYKYLKIAHTCAAARRFFVIDPSGYIKVCNHSPIRLCKWEKIETLENNSHWQSYVKRDFLPDMCTNCKDNTICDGGCREAANVNYGSNKAIDPCFDKQ
jgi:radical SAM protein with 4Fe4S-binding SPASM domain